MPDRGASGSAGLRRQVASGLAWATVGQGGTQLLHYAVVLVLAWRLPPGDFGLVGLATIYIFILNSVGEVGLGAALVQRSDLTPSHVAAAFWLSLAASVGLGLGVWAAAAPIAIFMREPRLVGVLQALAALVPLNALLVVPRALLQRDLRFRSLAATELGAEIVFGAVAIVLAYIGLGVWSLVHAFLARHLARAALLWRACPWSIGRTTPPACVAVLGFGGYVMGSTLLAQVVANLDYFVVGRYLGTTALGHYTLAFQLAIIPIQRFCGLLRKVGFPSLALIQTEHLRVSRAFARLLRTATALVAPLGVLLAMIAPWLIGFAYGAEWAPAVRPLQILAIASMFVVFDNAEVVFRAIGRPGWDLTLELAKAAVFGALIAAGGLRFGLVGVAASLLIALAGIGVAKLLAVRWLVRDRDGRLTLPLVYTMGLAGCAAMGAAGWPAGPLPGALGIAAAAAVAAWVCILSLRFLLRRPPGLALVQGLDT